MAISVVGLRCRGWGGSGRDGVLEALDEPVVSRERGRVDGRRDLLGFAGLVLPIGDKVSGRHLGGVRLVVGVSIHIDERMGLVCIIISD